MIIVMCNVCGRKREARLSPSGAVVMPRGWTQAVAIPEGCRSPRGAVNSCGNEDCRLEGHVPEGDTKWDTEAIR